MRREADRRLIFRRHYVLASRHAWFSFVRGDCDEADRTRFFFPAPKVDHELVFGEDRTPEMHDTSARKNPYLLRFTAAVTGLCRAVMR